MLQKKKKKTNNESLRHKFEQNQQFCQEQHFPCHPLE